MWCWLLVDQWREGDGPVQVLMGLQNGVLGGISAEGLVPCNHLQGVDSRKFELVVANRIVLKSSGRFDGAF